MLSLSSVRRSEAGSFKASVDHRETSDDELAHPRPRTREPKGPEMARNNPNAPNSETDSSPKAPTSKANKSTCPEPQFYLSDYITKKVSDKHENPVRAEYREGLAALKGHKDTHAGHAGAMDRRSLGRTARLRLQAGLETVLQPAMARDLKAYEGVLISEYLPHVKHVTKMHQSRKPKERGATIKRDDKRLAEGEAAQVHGGRGEARSRDVGVQAGFLGAAHRGRPG